MKKNPLLSIVIVSFNTKELLLACVNSIKRFADVSYEIIISDNGSTDGTLELFTSNKEIILIKNRENLGFAKANNKAKQFVKGEYILFLNPDTEITSSIFSKYIEKLSANKDLAAITPKLILANGELDKDTRRGFPTPWVALSHFSGIDRIFPRSPVFARYWYGFLPENKLHYVDVAQGAFLLVKKEVIDMVGWFDEDYFLDGEDIDLCWKIKDKGFNILYDPEQSVIHYKKASKKANKSLFAVTGGVKAMEIFYRKRLFQKYPVFINIIVVLGIKFLYLFRIIKYYLP